MCPSKGHYNQWAKASIPPNKKSYKRAFYNPSDYHQSVDWENEGHHHGEWYYRLMKICIQVRIFENRMPVNLQSWWQARAIL